MRLSDPQWQAKMSAEGHPLLVNREMCPWERLCGRGYPGVALQHLKATLPVCPAHHVRIELDSAVLVDSGRR
jgi:hypothetical protein